MTSSTIDVGPSQKLVRRRRTRTYLGLLLFFLVIAAAAAWVGVRADLARDHVNRARAEIVRIRAEVSAGRVVDLAAGVAEIRSDVHAAKRLTSDLGWSLASDLPVVGTTLRTASNLADLMTNLSDQALEPLVQASQSLDPQEIRRPDGRLDLVRLQSAAPELSAAEGAIGRVQDAIRALPSKHLLFSLGSDRTRLTTEIGSLAGFVDSARRAALVAPAMLGLDGPRRYLIVFETPAESRGTGGLVGSYSIVTAVNGKLTTEQSGSDDSLQDSPTPVVDLGDDFDARYGTVDSARGWRNANYTPNFPWAAEIWQHLWERQSGESIDGVISVDPIALGYILSATGSVRLADGEVITGKNAAHWTMVDSYARYANDNQERKRLLVQLAHTALDRLASGHGQTATLLKVLGRAAGQHRLLVWSGHPSEQVSVHGTPLAGELPTTTGPFVALIVRNGSGDKLDYYVHRTLDYSVRSCGPKSRIVDVSATLLNTAPRSGLPKYVTVRSDGRKVPVGQDRMLVDFFVTDGSSLRAAWLDGKRVSVYASSERGRPVFEADVELPIQKPQTLRLELEEPESKAGVQYFVQPLATPMSITAEESCQ